MSSINKKNEKGFILIELLVVIAIIAVPSLINNIDKAKVAEFKVEINAIKTAVLSNYIENGQYTTGTILYKAMKPEEKNIDITDELEIEGFGNTLDSPEMILIGINGKYLDLWIYFDEGKSPRERVLEQILAEIPNSEYNEFYNRLLIRLINN